MWGVFVVLLVSWFYILGMGWHMNTLPFVENKIMDMSHGHGKTNKFFRYNFNVDASL